VEKYRHALHFARFRITPLSTNPYVLTETTTSSPEKNITEIVRIKQIKEQTVIFDILATIKHPNLQTSKK